jgi:hypothetical protein
VVTRLIFAHFVKKFHTIYRTKRFIRVHKSPSLNPVLSQINTFHILTPYSVPFDACLYLLIDLFLSGLPTKILYAFLISHMHATCPVSLILIDFIALLIFYEEHGL